MHVKVFLTETWTLSCGGMVGGGWMEVGCVGPKCGMHGGKANGCTDNALSTGRRVGDYCPTPPTGRVMVCHQEEMNNRQRRTCVEISPCCEDHWGGWGRVWLGGQATDLSMQRRDVLFVDRYILSEQDDSHFPFMRRRPLYQHPYLSKYRT